MSILITTNRISPLLGAVLSEVESIGISPTVHFQREDRFVGPAPYKPPWLHAGDELMRARLKETEKWASAPAVVLALGLASASKAIDEFAGFPLVTLMTPGDLDFSPQNRAKSRTFAAVNRHSSSFIFVNEWEMTKAVSLGSTTPHFLWNPADLSAHVAPLHSDGGKIAVIYDDSKRVATDIETDSAFDSLKDTAEQLGKSVEFMPANSFYWYSDFMMGRKFANVLRLRLKDVSHALFVDEDADSIISYASMDNEPGEVMVASSVAAGLICRAKPSIAVSSTDTWAARVAGTAEVLADLPESSVSVGRPLVEILDSIMEAQVLPDYFEDFGDLDSFAVFLTVAAVENRSDGARPQRIRNMYLALSRSTPTIQVNLDPTVLGRRLKLIRSWLDNGINCEVVYGENSTNPVQSVDAVIQTYRFLDELASGYSTPSCWFVRDLHWLDPDLFSKKAAAKARQAGTFELERMSRSAGTVASPSIESAELFNELTKGHIDIKFPPHELPPAVSRENCVLLRGGTAGTTFLYAGGIGDAYKMGIYLDAVAEFLSGHADGEEVFFDFLVRPTEQSTLKRQLRDRRLHGHTSIRVLNGNLNEYRPLTAGIVGVLLLESAYANGALPYKSVSYIEKGIPFLVYEGSPAHRVFGRHGVVESIERNVSDVVSVMQQITRGERASNIEWRKVWAEENWDARIHAMREIAAVGSREV